MNGSCYCDCNKFIVDARRAEEMAEDQLRRVRAEINLAVEGTKEKDTLREIPLPRIASSMNDRSCTINMR